MSRAPVQRPASLRSQGTVPSKTSQEVKDSEKQFASLQQEGDSHRRAGNYEKAIKAYDALLARQPKDTKALTGRATARRGLQQREEALADYNAALKLEPGSASLLSGRGVVKSELGWYRAAASDFQAALDRNPNDSLATWGRGIVVQQESSAPLRILTLFGFRTVQGMNTQFVERRRPEFNIGGYETYWSLDNALVLFWCSLEKRWKGCRAIDIPKISAKRSVGFVGAPERTHILSSSLLRGWHEWNGSAWVKPESPEAGVSSIDLVSVPMRTLSLAGFKRAPVNTTYTERRQPQFMVNSRETYWSSDGSLFLFWCAAERRWRGCRSADLVKIQTKGSMSLFGAPRGADLFSPSMKKGWHEWASSGKEWIFTPESGAAVESRTLVPRTVTLIGFQTKGVNAEYIESRQKEHMVNDREIYYASSSGHFLYWAKTESRWKGSLFSNLQKIQAGKTLGVVGAPQGGDLLSMSLLRGWHEWDGNSWTFNSSAGVGSIATSRAVRRKKEPEVSAAAPAKKRKTVPLPPSSKTPSRQELIRDVFSHFDKDGDKLLMESEMLSFARSVGFDGSKAEWTEEYRMICKGLGRSPERGVDEASFWKLVNEDTDDGCYCSDKELAGMLGLKLG